MSEKQKPLRLDSPAKINLRLEILRKREDGYHEIRTIIQKISLHDTLYFSLRPERGIRIITNDPSLPTGRKNLIYQAVRALLERSDYRGGVEVLIEKRIPLGAGLGGGSSNAAAALNALNQLLRLKMNQKELMEEGVKIGADVPFFLFKGAAIGTGIGERLRKITLPTFWYLLINPNYEVSTRWAYQNSILTKTEYHINLHKLFRSKNGIARLLRNDLERVIALKYPEIDLMKELLLSAGAAGALMTGSGPTVFGLFPDEKKALKAYKKLKDGAEERGWKIFKAHSIP
jgi:4-diphosphocytidyl-2-C-methyl-D-erythritol kinase